MKTLAAAAGLLGLVLLGIAAASPQGHPGMMMGTYDPKSEVTLQGTIEKVYRPDHTTMPMMRGGMTGMGLHLVLKAENKDYEIHLGPAAFVERTMTFKEGDAIKVLGAKVTMMGEDVIMAREVTKGEQVLKLRDENGMPFWSGMMHRSGS